VQGSDRHCRIPHFFAPRVNDKIRRMTLCSRHNDGESAHDTGVRFCKAISAAAEAHPQGRRNQIDSLL
jgi:hypothetical protein